MASNSSEVMFNDESFVTVESVNVGSRKRTKNVIVRSLKKQARHSDPYAVCNSFKWLNEPCKHNQDNCKRSVFECFKLTENDVLKFRQNLFESKSKIDQDNFILLHTRTEASKRSRVAKSEAKRDKVSSSEFFIKVAGTNVRVCRQTFEETIKPIGKTRITGVLKRTFRSGQIAKETRGGDHIGYRNEPKKQSVREFLKKLQVRESHYGRNKSVRSYLPAEIKTIRNLYSMYTESLSNEDIFASFSMFYVIFSKEFNIGFNNPRVDSCTTCENFANRIKSEQDPDSIKEIKQQLRIHKKRSKAFYKTIRNKVDDQETAVIVFDLQQVQVLPKVPVQEAYYSRQLGLYNFGLCDMSNKKNYSYSWTENQSDRGSNEIASAVYHYLTEIMPSNENFLSVQHVLLASDGCGGQNKNNIMLTMIQSWVSGAPINIKTVTCLFPVRGHSFLECDRLFGRIQQDVIAFYTILLPKEYHNIYKKHVQSVFVYNGDWSIYDWKTRFVRNYKPLASIEKAKRSFYQTDRQKRS